MSNQFIYLKDNVSNCHSVIIHLKLKDYLNLVKPAYEHEGNIQGQRAALSSASAKKVREQMIKDFQNGSVLPPVVIGIVDHGFEQALLNPIDKFLTYIEEKQEDICIIDGMQRTTAMILSEVEDTDREIRVEFWIAESTNDLIYRMLVLNTGQVPWTMKRQLEVVLKPIIKELCQKVPNLTLIESNDLKRRKNPGEFQAEKIIESFLVFGARSEKVNKKDIIANEYTKLEFIESSSKQEILDFYSSVLKRFVRLDELFSRDIELDNNEPTKLKKGFDLFTSQPFLIGITVSFAIKILGRPKQNYSKEKQQKNLDKILNSFDDFLEKLNNLDQENLANFIALDELNALLPTSTSARIGDVERDFFKNSFNVLIEEDFDIENMSICWSH
ncbi:hypothetical protein K6U40_16240 [Vibrio fluvialis]|uniref:hypothetical protein n=1 Tax=Vibrio fluvialis TaxID=676 RepID=UPI001EEB4504|nr:hypothetical protein [Vibrio fluvialis]MCG6347028.1 hypothetical protein [Vibrio fluvialis]